MVSESRSNEIVGATANAGRPQPARVFVALKIAPEIADELAQLARGLQPFPVCLIMASDIHLTLVPPWNEVSPAEAVEKLCRVVDRFFPFTLTFRHVGYGPEPKRPRFLWAECVASKEIAEFRVALIQAFGQADERPFRPHVTLARLRDKGRALARKHPLDQDLALTQRIESIELMQSPPPDGSGYKILASVPLAVSL